MRQSPIYIRSLVVGGALAMFSLGTLEAQWAEQPRFAALPDYELFETEQPQQGVRKSPGTSALISFLFTGGGQIYNEEVAKGAVMLVLAVGFTYLAIDGIDEYDCDPSETCYEWFLPVGLTGALALKVWSIIDAAAGATRFNERMSMKATGPIRPRIDVVALNGGVGVGLLGAEF